MKQVYETSVWNKCGQCVVDLFWKYNRLRSLNVCEVAYLLGAHDGTPLLVQEAPPEEKAESGPAWLAISRAIASLLPIK